MPAQGLIDNKAFPRRAQTLDCVVRIFALFPAVSSLTAPPGRCASLHGQAFIFFLRFVWKTESLGKGLLGFAWKAHRISVLMDYIVVLSKWLQGGL